jgi:hypothetical protein
MGRARWREIGFDALAMTRERDRSEQEERHPGKGDDDHQDRNLDEPGEPDPATAMPFELWIHYRHFRLAD